MLYSLDEKRVQHCLVQSVNVGSVQLQIRRRDSRVLSFNYYMVGMHGCWP